VGFKIATVEGDVDECYCDRHARYVRIELEREGYQWTERLIRHYTPKPNPVEYTDRLIAEHERRKAERQARLREAEQYEPMPMPDPEKYPWMYCGMWHAANGTNGAAAYWQPPQET
jgi:hypothetical protein